jgi:O-antigen/teichoic acid export membrane protein
MGSTATAAAAGSDANTAANSAANATAPTPAAMNATRAPPWLPFANLGLRGLGLVGRLGLAIFLVRFFPLADVGSFGLIAGVVGMAPAILGWGLNYFLGRAIVDVPLPQAMQQMRRRLLITLVTVSVAATLTLAGYALAGVPWPPYMLPTMLLVVLECIAFDVQMSLIALRMSLAANLILFVRSAAWVFPAALAAFLHSELRTLSFMLWSWLAGVAVCYLVLGVMAWRARFPLRARAHPGQTWVDDWARRGGWLIYLNDIGIVGLLYFDRYIVTHFLGLEVAGAFTSYWSVANAVHILIFTGWLQPSLPHLVSALRRGDEADWRRQLVRLGRVIVGVGLSLSLLLFAAVVWGLPAVGVNRLQGYSALFALMLAGTVVRLLADLMHQAMYTRALDRPLALINILGIAITLIVSAGCIAAFGLLGAGIATLLTPLLLLLMRAAALARWHTSHV